MELKKCPFCGGEAEEMVMRDVEGDVVQEGVWCPNCGANMPGDIENSIVAWNARAGEGDAE